MLKKKQIENENIEAIQLDVTDQVSVDNFVKALNGRPVALLVNNAGGAFDSAPIEKADPTIWQKTYEVNVIGPLHQTVSGSLFSSTRIQRHDPGRALQRCFDAVDHTGALGLRQFLCEHTDLAGGALPACLGQLGLVEQSPGHPAHDHSGQCGHPDQVQWSVPCVSATAHLCDFRIRLHHEQLRRLSGTA